MNILDEHADPEGVEVWPYEGPLFIDIDLPTDRVAPIREAASKASHESPLTPDDVELGDLSEIIEGEGPRVTIPDCDTGLEMQAAVFELAFPHLHEALERLEEPGDAESEERARAAIHEAVRKEALRMVETSWRSAARARSDDPDAQLATLLGTTVEWVRQHASEPDDDLDDDDIPF